MVERFVTVLAWMLAPMCIFLLVGAFGMDESKRDGIWAGSTIVFFFVALFSLAWLVARYAF